MARRALFGSKARPFQHDYGTYNSAMTTSYRGHWIHCAVSAHGEACNVTDGEGNHLGTYRSLTSAKRAISRRKKR